MIMFKNFFNPKSVAVIGASADPQKVGFALVSNLLKGKKREIYPVTLKEEKILGIPAFKSVSNVPGKIDLAVIAVGADIVPRILEECGRKKIPNAIIISSGFKEIGPSGKELEDKISVIAKENNIALLGPNCLGIMDTKNDFNVSFSARKPLAGKIAFLSQSGALGTAMIDWAADEGIGFSKFISLGNEARLTEIEFLEYLRDDPETSAILVYIESLYDGSRFMETLKRITPQKPVVVIKAGMGSHGNLAVMSHTGALAPEASVFISACKQAGAVTTSSLRGFFNVVKILSKATDTKPVQRLIVLTNGGGPSVVTADLIDRSKSLSLSTLSENMKEELRKILPRMAAIGNPVDILGDALAERYDRALEILTKDENTDGIIVIVTPQMMTEAEATAKILAKYKNKKRIFPIFIGGSSLQAGRNEIIRLGMVCFPFPRDVIDGLDYLAKSAPKIKSPYGHHGDSAEPVSRTEMMHFESALKYLSEYNIPVSGKFIKRKEDLGSALHECGDGPYAMKAISGSIIHKTETGAVRLNIKNFEEAGMVWEELWQKFVHLDGILIQPMIENEREVIVGMKRDNVFGPVVVFGLGGIFAEAIKDTAMRIAPVSKEEAIKMMREIKGVKILEGMRGQPPVNFDLLADIIVNLSRLSLDNPKIKEIDLNPVICSDTSATIVDARVMM